MSNRPVRHPDRVFTNRGMVNDVEANLLKLCQKAFEENESLRGKVNSFPRVWKACDPNKITSADDFPALYVWCDGWRPWAPTIGKMGSKEITQRMGFYCNVQYILPLVKDEEGDKIMKEIAWALFDEITKNQNLYDLVDGDTEILEVTTYPDLKFVGKAITQVSNVNIKIMFPYQRRTKMSTR